MCILWAQSIRTLLYMKKTKCENTLAHLQMGRQWKRGVIPIIWFTRKSKGQHLAIIPDVSKIGYLKLHSIIILPWKYSSVIQCIFKCKRTGTCSRRQSPRYWSCNLGDALFGQFKSPCSVKPQESAVSPYLLGKAHLVSIKKSQSPIILSTELCSVFCLVFMWSVQHWLRPFFTLFLFHCLGQKSRIMCLCGIIPTILW